VSLERSFGLLILVADQVQFIGKRIHDLVYTTDLQTTDWGPNPAHVYILSITKN